MVVLGRDAKAIQYDLWRTVGDVIAVRVGYEQQVRQADQPHPAQSDLDAHQPLHATDNYDGGSTGQAGIHSRFERDLFERFQSRLSISPPPVKPITAPRDAAFDVLLASFQLVDPLLAADKKAVAGKDVYDDAYFEAFFIAIKPLMEQQLGGAISATASLIIGAWEQAGRPAIKLDGRRPVQRVKPDR